MKTKKIFSIVMSLLLVFIMGVVSSTASYAASGAKQSAKTTKTAKTKKVTVSKSSAIYKELSQNGMFDYEYYAKNNPDVVAVYGLNQKALLNHFINYGIFEARQPNKDFNINVYASAYADLQNAFGGKTNTSQMILDYYNHYAKYGKNEGRNITSFETAAAAGITVKTIGEEGKVLGATTTDPVPSSGSASSGSGSSNNASYLKEFFCYYINPSCGLVMHTFGAETLVIPATATECAYYGSTCTNCGYRRLAQNHEMRCIVMEPATPEHDGYDIIKCRICGGCETVPNPIHYWGPWEDSEPSATNPCGGRSKKCVNCGLTETEPHSPGPWTVVKETTDTEDGRSECHCTSCGVMIYYSENHFWGEKILESEATAYSGPVYIRKCKNCDTVWRTIE